MQPPKNAKILDQRTSSMWFSEDGILCSVSKKAIPPTIEEVNRTVEAFKQFTGGNKVCLLIDNTNASAPNKEMRDRVAKIMPEIVKAVAIISKSAVGKMVANLFFNINKQSYPIRMFDDETEAREWLKQYV